MYLDLKNLKTRRTVTRQIFAIPQTEYEKMTLINDPIQAE